jgi:hypothetical protein
MQIEHPTSADVRLAIVIESLYLGNLLLAPVLAYAALVWLALRGRTDAHPLAACHLAQVLRAGLLGALLPLCAVGLIFAMGGFVSLTAWIVAEVYIIFIHTPLILLGLAGLLKAMAGKPYVFPLIGKRC